MKHLKLYSQWGKCYENFDWAEEDFDFEEEKINWIKIPEYIILPIGTKVMINPNEISLILKNVYPINIIGKIIRSTENPFNLNPKLKNVALYYVKWENDTSNYYNNKHLLYNPSSL